MARRRPPSRSGKAPNSGAPSRPSREDIAKYLRESTRKVGKRELARAFGLGKDDGDWLGQILREFAAEGVIKRRRGDRARPDVGLPTVAVLQVISISRDGDLTAAPADWRGEGPAPRIHLIPTHNVPAPAVGDRVLARTKVLEDRTVEARPMRLLERGPEEVLGVYEIVGGEGRIRPANKRQRTEFLVRGTDAGDAKPGDVVVADVMADARNGLGRARVRERVGGLDDPRTLSLIAIHEHGIPTRFSKEALAEADAGHVPPLGRRTDFRAVPFVTIDPVDARDFDDAVWAEPDTDAGNPGGWHIKVAVADVAEYVRPDSALDREAHLRGNSVYFPDRVVPMLPHALSSGMCSLQAGEERACLVATMWLDAEGNVTRHKIERGLMRSVMRLTYERAQEIHDRGGDPTAERLLTPLWGAFDAFTKGRERRKPLAIESPELVVRLGSDGHVADVRPRAHIDSMRLIEEYMIAANVATALTLGASQWPTMYRIHDEPDPERVAALRTFLESLNYKLAAGQRLRPSHFNAVLLRAKDTPHEAVVNQIVLRTQAQAVYSPEASPHFGLALNRYVHFTSPIRRYADLLVHRALISALRLGDDGLPAPDLEQFARTAEHISTTERRAAMAERDATDRYLAAFLSDKVGALFAARVSGVTSAGLFVTLAETGASALIPMRTIGDERFLLDESHHRIIGERTHRVLQLGDAIEVRLREATAASGGLLAELMSGGRIDRTARPGRSQRPNRPPGKGGPPRGVRRGRRK